MFNIAGNAPSGYDVKNSLRFRNSASAYLSRTPASAGNQKTWTWSGWVKAARFGSQQPIYTSFSSTSNYAMFTFSANAFINTTDNIKVYVAVANVLQIGLETTAVYRDPSAWYHIVLVIDTTQATAANRVKLYVNGSQVTSFSTATYPSLNADIGFFNTTTAQQIGSLATGTYGYFDGYMAELNFVDGQALTPSSFGSTDAITGQWLPKLYSGTYGNNGFYLKFADASAATAAAIGKDSSSNGNNWTPSGISVTAGVTYDAMTDSPTLTSPTVANYPTLNPLDTTSGSTFANANLSFTSSGIVDRGTRSTIALPSSGLYYTEVNATVTTSAAIGASVGLATTNVTIPSGSGSSANVWVLYASSSISLFANGTAAYSAAGTINSGSVYQIAYDAANNRAWIGVNNVWYNSSGGTTGNPSAGTNPTFTSLPAVSLFVSSYNGMNWQANFGQRPFAYTPPTGFVALNTFNLPTPAIRKGSSYMDATTYTGTGATLSLTNTSAFKPDLVYIKGRSGATDNAWYDSVRGTTKELVSNSAAAETTQATGLTAFNANGFTIGALAKLNTSAATYVGWQWQAGQGTTTTGTGTGGITSVTQSVNTTAGFSIVNYTGSGANGTVTHGLGVAPKMVLIKNRSGALDWIVGHTGLTSWAYNMYLNLTAAQGNNTIAFNSTAPTSSVFSLGTWNAANGSGNSMVAYCWAEIEGFSKIGTYTGNGSADGTFVYTGFRPKFVMYKARDYAEGWIIYDTSRNPSNLTNLCITPYGANAEFDGASFSRAMDILSNGFKPRGTDTNINGSGYVYIYMAFAENPFKHSNAR
jgi:hypothetical protein